MAKTKIEWTDETWNPVWGCRGGCDYCYARKIAKRFASQMAEKNGIYDWNDGELLAPNGKYQEHNQEEIFCNLKEFEPTFLGANYEFGISDFNILKSNGYPKKNKRRIFVGSMSDIAFWQDEWIRLVAQKIKRYPFHTFQLLTKFPEVYQKLDEIMPYNVWFGLTVTNKKDLEKMPKMIQIENPVKRKLFTSFEPVTEHIPTKWLFGAGLTNWIIVGAMTGKNKQRTKTEWIGSIVADAKKYNIPVFVKQLEINGKVEKNINKFPQELRIRQYPKIDYLKAID